MPENDKNAESNNEQLQFLICSQCNGLGYVGNKKCRNCDGHGIIGYLDGYILYWSKIINPQYIKLYKLEKIASIITLIILIIIGVLGLASLIYSFYLVYLNDFLRILEADYWLSGENEFHFYFWLSFIFDLYLIYFVSLIKEQKQTVLAKKYESESEQSAIAPPPADWLQVKSFGNKNKIDIAKAFSKEAGQVIEKAFEVAARYKAIEVSPIHFLIAAFIVSNQMGSIFSRLGVDFNDLAKKLGRVAARYPQTEGKTVFSSESIKLLMKAYRAAYDNKLEKVDTTEIAQEAIKADKMIQEVLFDINISLEQVNNVILWQRIRQLLRQQWQTYRASSRLKSKTGIDRAMTAVQTQYLNQFSEDLTLLAKMGYLPLCIDRESEFNEMFRVLEGSSIKGIVLVGSPGVGKTAIMEGLAQKMIADDVPEFLRDKRLVSLSVSRLLSGASASEAQQRLLICVNELIKAGNVVLYIDNIQDIMGISAGSGESLDLSDVIVEALSKNLFILISTSTPISYVNSIETTSLGNILKKITIAEPEFNEAVQIIAGKVGKIEGKNNIFFSYRALENAVKLTDRYITDKFLPYKAISLLEEAGAWAKTNKGAGSLVTGNDVATLLSEKINMPVSDITESESEKLLKLEEIIHERMVDQEEAVSAVANSLRRARTELRDVDRPIANLLFLGPTGVGKTELAKTIAQVYFNSEENMVRLDMSEYQEKSSINRLIGAPPGQAGAGTGGQLTEAVRQKPFSIVLLDELEKAHADILNVFLQVMEDGRLTDATGRTIDFTNTIIIATSNAGSSYIQQKIKEKVPVEKIKKDLLETQLKDYFRPEFLNRFNNIIVFKPLSYEDVVKIAHLMLNDVAKNLEAKGIHFQASEEAVKELAKIGFDPQFGARPLRRAIQKHVDNALAQYLIKGKIGRRDVAILESGGVIRVEKAKKL